MKKYAIILGILFITYLLTLDFKKSKNNDEAKKEIIDKQIVTVFYNNENLNMELDDYVVGVLSCEMPALFNEEALKAGAIAIRTFYQYKKNKDNEYIASVTDQCFNNEIDLKSKWNDNYENYLSKIKEAVKSTEGEYIYYNDELIEAFYYSISNGYSEDVKEVFNLDLPYLTTVESLWDKNVNNYSVNKEFSKEEFLNKLNIYASNGINVNIISKTESGRIRDLEINKKYFKATDFRKLLNIRSTDFEIAINNDKVVITTKGYGHGVGMSQYGANEMAKMGYNYKDILKHYYTGVEILKISV